MAQRNVYTGPDLYHYTTPQGAEGIAKDNGLIKSTKATKANLSRDVLLGPGVYLTDLNPANHSKAEILKNIYPGSTSGRQRNADHAIPVRRDDIQRDIDRGCRVMRSANNPHIFVHQDPADVRAEARTASKGARFGDKVPCTKSTPAKQGNSTKTQGTSRRN